MENRIFLDQGTCETPRNLASRSKCERGSNQQRYWVLQKDPKNTVTKELSDNSVTKWQGDWDYTTKGAITKIYFPKITDRLKLKINMTPNSTTMIKRHGNINLYLFKNKIRVSPMCSCKRGEQTIDHILFGCELVEQERDRLKAAVLRSEKWPVSKDTLMNKYWKNLKNSWTVYLLINYREKKIIITHS